MVKARGDVKGSRIIVEESHVKSRGSNGRVERTVQTTEGQKRAMNITFEHDFRKQHEAQPSVINLTGYERVEGKTAKVLSLEIRRKVIVENNAEV